MTPAGPGSPSTVVVPDPWSTVVGQPRAVAELQAAAASPAHAYLFVGPRGSGKRALARAFAGVLLGHDKDEPGRDVTLALSETHPDLVVVERVAASISAAQAEQIIQRATRAPVESSRKVLVLDEFHLVTDVVGPKLLKIIEEPPEGTYFLILAEEVPHDLVTLASRCVRVDLGPVPREAIVEELVRGGVDADRAEIAADAAGGDLRRAQVLGADERLELRRRLWWELPDRLDGTGASACVAVDELLAAIDDAMGPLLERHAEESAALDAHEEQFGTRGSGRGDVEARQKREQRRYRTDELRFGLATLARRYREQLAASSRPAQVVDALSAIQHLAEEMKRNPNDRLQLQALFLRLGDAGR